MARCPIGRDYRLDFDRSLQIATPQDAEMMKRTVIFVALISWLFMISAVAVNRYLAPDLPIAQLVPERVEAPNVRDSSPAPSEPPLLLSRSEILNSVQLTAYCLASQSSNQQNVCTAVISTLEDASRFDERESEVGASFLLRNFLSAPPAHVGDLRFVQNLVRSSRTAPIEARSLQLLLAEQIRIREAVRMQEARAKARSVGLVSDSLWLVGFMLQVCLMVVYFAVSRSRNSKSNRPTA